MSTISARETQLLLCSLLECLVCPTEVSLEPGSRTNIDKNVQRPWVTWGNDVHVQEKESEIFLQLRCHETQKLRGGVIRFARGVFWCRSMETTETSGATDTLLIQFTISVIYMMLLSDYIHAWHTLTCTLTHIRAHSHTCTRTGTCSQAETVVGCFKDKCMNLWHLFWRLDLIITIIMQKLDSFCLHSWVIEMYRTQYLVIAGLPSSNSEYIFTFYSLRRSFDPNTVQDLTWYFYILTYSQQWNH